VAQEKTITPSSDRAGHDFSGDGIVSSLGNENSTGDFIGYTLDPGDPPFDPASFEEKRLAFESIGIMIRHTPVASPAADFQSLIAIKTSNFSVALQHPKLIVQYIEP